MQKRTIGGVHLHYYALCQRKLWFYDKGICMEEESDQVLKGTVLHEHAYPRLTKKELMIDDAFKIDALDGKYVREIKLSSKMQNADEMQMLFYLYQLALRGINKTGLISYTNEKKTVEVELTEENIKKVKRAIAGVYEVLEKKTPPAVKKLPYCKSCAYYEFCYAMEADEE